MHVVRPRAGCTDGKRKGIGLWAVPLALSDVQSWWEV